MTDITTKPLLPRLDAVITKVWGFPPSRLSPEGVVRLGTDFFTLLVSGMFVVYFPTAQSPDPMVQWLGAAGMMFVMIWGFLPTMTRIMFGRYSYYLKGDEE